MENNWSQEIEDELTFKIESMSRSKTSFLNVRLLNLSAKKVDEFSTTCPHCSACKSKYHSWVNQLDVLLESETERKIYEAQLMEIVSHLEKQHQIKSKRYYTALYTFLGLMTGAIVGFILDWFINKEFLSFLGLYGALIGLIAGRITGWLVDKKKIKLGLTY
jgi:F0F1-type ATP synthase assembly protein I